MPMSAIKFRQIPAQIIGMNSKVVLRRSWSVARSYRGHARISSFVDLGVPSSYRLPLTLLPSVSALPPSIDFSADLLLPLETIHDHLRRENISPMCHVNILPQDIRDLENTIVFTSVLASQNLSASEQLQRSASQPSAEGPKPEKPKWEDEQYPDIGKSIIFSLTKLIIAIDIVSNHLPFLFIQPLPKSILAPKIELRLFPSSYPSFPALRLPKIMYRTIFRTARWLAPVFLHRTLRSFGKPSGVKGIGLEITCLRVIKIENGRRIEARWRTVSSPWSPSAPTNTAETMPRTWSGWFYFDINRQGLVVRHVVENVNNQRNVEGEHNLKDILVRTVSNGKRLADGLEAVQVDKVLQRDGSILRRLNVDPRIFPEPSPSNIFVSARTYC